MRKKKSAPPQFPNAERVHAYARAVVDGGDELAGRLVKLACNRHLDDLATAGGRGLVWKPEMAEACLVFAEGAVNLAKDKPLKLDEFEAFILGSLTGWYRADGFRRFKLAFLEIAKCNGKTPLGAVLCLFGMMIDDEVAPEVYSAAHKKDIAQVCFKHAKRMVQASPALKKTILPQVGSLSIPATMAAMRPLSSDDNSLDGPEVHIGVVDELQEHRDGGVVLKMQAATKNRRNAIIMVLCNSGHNRASAVWQYHDLAVRVLQGTETGRDDFFAFIPTLDSCPKCFHSNGALLPNPKCERCDDWRDRKVWKKANPGLGTICPLDYLEKQVATAKSMTSARNEILRLNFSLWTETATAWANMYAWNNECYAAKLSIDDFAGQPCYLAIDAANKIDLTALVAVFERKPGSGALDPSKLSEAVRVILAALASEAKLMAEESPRLEGDDPPPAVPRALAAAGYAFFGWYFVPEAMVNNSTAANHERYKLWQSKGQLNVTEGARTDFMAIEDKLKELNQKFQVKRLSFDPREMSYLVQRIQIWAGFDLVEVTQSPAMMSQPMKELEALIAGGLMKHNGDPAFGWMLANVIQKTARSGGPVKYYFPGKPSDDAKIDGPVALIMALDGALRGGEAAGQPGMAMLG